MGETQNERYDRLIEKRIEALESDVDSLKTWRSWILGLVAGIGIMVGAFAKNFGEIIKHLAGGL